MTLGFLAVGAAVTAATGGVAAPMVITSAVEVVGSVAAATGAATTATTTVATALTGAGVAAATGSGVAGTVAGGALASGMTTGAAYAGLAGASALGPVGALIACFKDDTQVQKIDGSIANVDQLTAGDIIKSLDIEDIGNETVFSKVTNVTILKGCFTAHEMHFRNGTVLTATSPHYMIIFNKGNVQIIQARDVKVGDRMCFGYEKFSVVVQIKDVQLDRKVNVEVENGLMYVNGVLATGVCELGPRVTFSANMFLAHYKATHFQAVCA